MSKGSTRVRRGVVAVCLGLAVTCGLASASAGVHDGRAQESGARRVESPANAHQGNATVVYPPKDATAPRPLVVYLHGRCGLARNGCGYFRAGAEALGWLVCPQANAECAGGGSSWGGPFDERSAHVHRAVAGVTADFPGRIDIDAPGVLVGFSQGAWLAIDLAIREPGRWTGLFLIGADVDPKPSDLRVAGVRRVVLAAGRNDGAYPAMAAEAHRLVASGIDARFTSLGLVGHTYAAEHEEVLATSLAWAAERDPPPSM
jgi:poly(3-hydroxybutyrate) depolymerase